MAQSILLGNMYLAKKILKKLFFIITHIVFWSNGQDEAYPTEEEEKVEWLCQTRVLHLNDLVKDWWTII